MILILQFSIIFGCRNDSELLQPDDSQRLIIYTSHKEEVYEPIIREFENRTGIWVTVITGGTNELLDQIASGSAAGRCDLMFGGGIESLMSCIDSFESYTCENRSFLLPEYEISDSRITPFSALPIVLIYNTRLIESTELKGWSSLLDPTLCGQIAFANPAVSGSSYTMLCTLCQILGGNPSSVLHDFAKNLDGKQLSGSGSVLDAVADGILPVWMKREA